jgi:hypothetical protein
MEGGRYITCRLLSLIPVPGNGGMGGGVRVGTGGWKGRVRRARVHQSGTEFKLFGRKEDAVMEGEGNIDPRSPQITRCVDDAAKAA